MNGQEASWDLPDTFEAPGLARHRVVATLTGWGADTLLDDAQLVTSELVTNAVIHARSASRLGLQFDGASLWIRVRDFGGGQPRIRQPDPTGGRGLRVIDHVAKRWGVEPDDATEGKTIWCELAG